jgi:hypothetical protein
VKHQDAAIHQPVAAPESIDEEISMSTIHIDEAGQAAEFHDVVQSVSITHLLQQRDAVLERLAQAFRILQEAHDIAFNAHLGFPHIVASKDYRGSGQDVVGEYATNGEALSACRAAIDATAWRYLMQESGMRSLMSASKRREFDEHVSKGRMPELTRETVYATFGALHESRADMFDQGVIECFKKLSWVYKTNLPQKFGKRIIVSYLTYTYGINHSAADHLGDLMRVFHILDGKPEADYRQGCFAQIGIAIREQTAWPKSYQNDYFALKLFRNGNGHLCFKRLELIDAMNGIIARHYPNALAAPR